MHNVLISIASMSCLYIPGIRIWWCNTAGTICHHDSDRPKHLHVVSRNSYRLRMCIGFVHTSVSDPLEGCQYLLMTQPSSSIRFRGLLK